MPTIADFAVVQDDPFLLPTATVPPQAEREFRDVSFPAVSTTSPAVLMFRVQMIDAQSTIQVRINQTVVTRQTLERGKHAWVEVIPAGVLRPARNSVLVSMTTDDDKASILIGSIVVQFQTAIAA
jgi:hypothetical protein